MKLSPNVNKILDISNSNETSFTKLVFPIFFIIFNKGICNNIQLINDILVNETICEAFKFFHFFVVHFISTYFTTLFIFFNYLYFYFYLKIRKLFLLFYLNHVLLLVIFAIPFF